MNPEQINELIQVLKRTKPVERFIADEYRDGVQTGKIEQWDLIRDELLRSLSKTSENFDRAQFLKACEL